MLFYYIKRDVAQINGFINIFMMGWDAKGRGILYMNVN